MKTAWDLSHIYKDNARAREELAALSKEAEDFAARYAGQLAKKLANVADIDKALRELEILSERCGRVGAYAYLGFAQNSDAGGAFMQEVQNELAKIEAKLVFFEVEFCELFKGAKVPGECGKAAGESAKTPGEHNLSGRLAKSQSSRGVGDSTMGVAAAAAAAADAEQSPISTPPVGGDSTMGVADLPAHAPGDQRAVTAQISSTAAADTAAAEQSPFSAPPVGGDSTMGVADLAAYAPGDQRAVTAQISSTADTAADTAADIAGAVADIDLSRSAYAYQIALWLQNARYNLSAECEQLSERLSPLGAAAFSRFFDEYLAFIDFRFDGEKITEEALLAKLYDADRSVRERAADAMSAALSAHQKPLVFIFNQIKNAHAIKGELRGYEHPMAARNASNQTSDAAVSALIAAAEGSFELVHRYYRKKGEILGIAELKDYDRYAPIDAALGASEQKYSFEHCVDTVRRCFSAFSPRFAELFDAALKQGRVDVFPAPAKRSGAFAYGVSPAPYVMLNHTDGRRDLFTLAHEMGHLIHQSLAIAANGYFYHHTPLTTAETASVFAEMLVFDELRKSLAASERKALLASKIEDIFATFYRQINFTTFEQRLHAAPGELSAEQIAAIWLEESRKMFGSALSLGEDYRYWFSYVPHFIHSPFYCYSYAFAQLLVLALFGLYKSGACADFVPRYEAFLAAGGSASPAELVASFGLDLESADFWRLGVAQIEQLVKEFCE